VQTYDPSKVAVKFGDIEWTGFAESDIKLPNITTTDMATYAKDHPNYAEDLVRVDVSEVFDDKGNSFNVSFKLKKGHPLLERILSLDPHDTTTIKVGE
jgi:hypothetical protein